jgi:hypothetical protein
MFSTSIAAFAISFLSIAATSTASPLIARVPVGCRPNFEGVGVSVVNQAVEWGLPAGSNSVTNEITTLGNAEFRFEFNGSPANTYVIKYVPRAYPYIIWPDLFATDPSRSRSGLNMFLAEAAGSLNSNPKTSAPQLPRKLALFARSRYQLTNAPPLKQ